MIQKLSYSNRSEWEQLRNNLIHEKALIGASSVAAVVGASKWKSPLRMYYELLGKVEKSKDTNTTLLGNYMEIYTKDRYQTFSSDEQESISNYKNGIITKPIKEIDHILVNEELGIFASLDWLAVNGEYEHPVDAKNTSFIYHKEWSKLYSNKRFDTGSCIPEIYDFQLSAQCLLTNSEYAELAVLCEGVLHIYPFYQNQDLVDYMLEKVAEFRMRVIKARLNPELESDLEPDITELEEETLTRKELNNSTNGLELLGDEEDQQMRDDYKEAIRIEKTAKDIKQRAKNHFLKKLKEFEVLRLPGEGRVTKSNFRVY